MTTPLEQTMPVYHFRERHSRWIDASPEQVWQALTTLTLDQLTLTRPLVAIRHFAAHTAAPTKPLFTDGPVRIFEITPPIYAVGGAVARPWQHRPERRDVASLEEFTRFAEPGWTKYLRRSRGFARRRWPLRGSSGHRGRVILGFVDGRGG